MAAMKKKTVMISKMRDSTFMACLSAPRGDRLGRRALRAVGVERVGGVGLGCAQLAAVERAQRLAGGIERTRGRVDLLAQRDPPVVQRRAQGPDLEVHHGVVRAT